MKNMVPAFNNQVALITGAGSGIGRELAMQMAREGAIVAALDLHAETLQQLMVDLQASGGVGAFQVANVTKLDEQRAAVAGFEQRLGPIEIAIASAGIGRPTPAKDFDVQNFQEQIEVNLIGVANTFAAVIPGMRQRKRGHLVALSSMASYRGLPHMAGYCASKAGVNALMDSFRFELRSSGIDCTTICPGWIRTPLTQQIPVPKEDLLEVEPAVRLMVDALRRKRSFTAFPLKPRAMLMFIRWLPTGLGDWLLGLWASRLRNMMKK
jgi:NAD(P)-dependent dehydrogenase (short-subunit alcohol dehydrogenase family)